MPGMKHSTKYELHLAVAGIYAFHKVVRVAMVVDGCIPIP